MQVNTRNVILDILLEVNEKEQYVNLVLSDALRKYQYLSHTERAFISHVVLGSVERKITLDYVIDSFSKVKVKKMKPLIRNIMRMSVYQILYMEGTADFAVCNEAVKLAATRGFSTLKGFVNGVLRNIVRNKQNISYPDRGSSDFLSVKYSVPQWLTDMWLQAYGYENTVSMLDSQFAKRALTIRCNMALTTPDELAERLTNQGISVKRSSHVNEALMISGYDYLEGLAEFNEGLFTVQDASSMLVKYAASPKPGDKVIDVCAAPGGKSLHIAEVIGSEGHIEARDISYAKTALIEENIARMHFNNIDTCVADAMEFDCEWENKADIVIADLPCSGLGILNKKPDIKYHASQEGTEELAKLQRKILGVVSRYVKPGGTLVYSTCTVNPAENTENALHFAGQSGFEIINLKSVIPESIYDCLTEDGFVEIRPGMLDNEFDGFFIAGFKKQEKI